MTGTAGTCVPELEPLRDLLEKNLADGTDAGAALAVVHDGELVVDLWGGEARRGCPGRDTITQVWSVTKTMAALTCSPRSSGPDRPRRPGGDLLAGVPAGKEASWSGTCSGTPRVTRVGRADHRRGHPRPGASRALLAEQAPWYEPGSAPAYQIVEPRPPDRRHRPRCHRAGRSPTSCTTTSWLRSAAASGSASPTTSSTVRRPRSTRRPTNIDYAALRPDHFLVPHDREPAAAARGQLQHRAWRRVPSAAANGHGNARGIAQAQALVSHGGEVDGVRCSRPRRSSGSSRSSPTGSTWCCVPVRFGIGYALPHGVGAGDPVRAGSAGGPGTADRSSSTTSTGARPSPT